jgi:3D-(3,5/4)-trihydroxycyclohexane-1,2-dione acylhydrolase (decyclizing)
VASLADAVAAIKAAKAPIIIASGSVVYSEATEQLAQFVDQTGIPVGITQAGKGSVAHNHPLAFRCSAP